MEKVDYINQGELASYYDVIIVGAGPGGLECAKVLSESNKSVLLLEKNPTIGKKICAGGLTRKAMDFLNLPEDFGGRKFQKIIFKTRFSEILLDYEEDYVHVIDREKLGQWQKKKIDNTLIKIVTNAQVTEISKDFVTINGTQNIGFAYLVGADGSNSIVRKFLKLKTEKLLVAFQYIIKENLPNMASEFNSNLFNAGFAWIFPAGNFTSVGTGCSPKAMGMKKLRENFNIWLKRMNIDVSQGEFQAFPINYDFRGYRFGNIFLVGDAAGFAYPFSGEGIYQALISGNEVAKSILNNNYYPVGILGILKERKIHLSVMWFFRIIGPFRIIFYELILLIIKNKFLAKLLLKFLSQNGRYIEKNN